MRKKTWTDQVHQTWQIDGKELVTLKSGKKVSWMSIADEESSAHLKAVVMEEPVMASIKLELAIDIVNKCLSGDIEF